MNIVCKEKEGVTKISFTEGTVTKHADGSLFIGAGELAKLNTRKLRLLVRKAVRTAKDQELTEVAIDADSIPNPEQVSDYELGRLVAENALMAAYEFTRYKKKKEGGYEGLETLFVDNSSNEFEQGVTAGIIVGTEINFARDLANTPGGDMTPTILAEAAQDAAKDLPIEVTVLEKDAVEELGMGLVLGVDRGAAEPLKFIIMEYWGAGKGNEKPIVFVGKGITFDTGGINLKPSDSILGMNQDMTGGAVVMSTICAAAKLKLKKNVIALVPAVENSISGSAMRPGDILTAMNGTTVEIGNTDAEGRLILSDALTYAERYEPSLVIDIATLTGAAIVVAGKRASVVMTKNAELESELKTIGEAAGDYLISLPLWEEYEGELKSNLADLCNISGVGSSAKSGAGCIQGGIFISHFAKSFPAWAHLDIASRMESIPEDNLAKGATGEPIRLLVRLVEQMQPGKLTARTTE